MTEVKDKELIAELTKATQEGKIRWIATAIPNEFTASFRGKYSVVVREYVGLSSEGFGGPAPAACYELTVEDESGMIIHRLEDDSIRALIDFARRSAFHADKAIDEILVELKSR